MRKVIERCPACGGALAVTRLTCTGCDTEIHGRFQATIFDRLSPESLAFVETFVRLRGNVKEMERELSVPYNAVRSRLDDVIAELGFAPGPRAPDPPAPPPSPPPPGAPGQTRRDILDRLDRGEITPAEATELLESPE